LTFLLFWEKIILSEERMKDIWKGILTLILFGSAFLLGYYFGEEKIKNKIPNFQEEEDFNL
jgi:hypothetical protein